MKLRHFYPIALLLLLVYASFFVLNIILPSIVFISGYAKFKINENFNEYSVGGKVSKLAQFSNNLYNTQQLNQSVSIIHSESEGKSVSKAITNVILKHSTSTPSSRHVTKSLEELGYVSGRVNPDFLFFNRVPKCGSEMIVLLLQWLQGINGFKHIRLGGGKVRRLKRLQQEELVDEVIKHEKDALPLSFDRHVYWLNFSSFDHSTPVWINIIRDPVEKAASRFYYSKELNKKSLSKKDMYQSFEECIESAQDMNCRFKSGEMYDLTIPYFCGHEKWCMALNDEWALEEAKANVDRYYPVVGILEEINITLAVMEKKIPRFFSGVQDMYFRELLEPHHNKNRKRPRGIDEDFRNHLKSSLKLEYEFYNFIKSRLFNQYFHS